MNTYHAQCWTVDSTKVKNISFFFFAKSTSRFSIYLLYKTASSIEEKHFQYLHLVIKIQGRSQNFFAFFTLTWVSLLSTSSEQLLKNIKDNCRIFSMHANNHQLMMETYLSIKFHSKWDVFRTQTKINKCSIVFMNESCSTTIQQKDEQ